MWRTDNTVSTRQRGNDQTLHMILQIEDTKGATRICRNEGQTMQRPKGQPIQWPKGQTTIYKALYRKLKIKQ